MESLLLSLKQKFASNFRGISSMLELSALLIIVPILVLSRHFFSSYGRKEIPLMKSDDAFTASKNLEVYVVSFAMDFLFIVLPTLLIFTLLAEWVYTLASLSVIFLIFLIKTAERFNSNEGQFNSFKTDISSYRVALMIITCLCILSIDFNIFPRRYGKTETYGTGLMDLGVGSFVVANSIVSGQARNVSSMNWKSAFQSSIPLLLLGFGRLVSTTLVGYQIHVSAYGVHWNFFFTLAALSFLISIFNIPPHYSAILGSAILIGYQTWLNTGLNMVLLSSQRGTDIISQNKEGVFSILGYWGLYLLGVQLGHYLFFGNKSWANPRSKKSTRTRVWILSLLFWLLTLILHCYVEKVSRRTCNMAYVTWVLAQNLQLLGIFMLSDYIPGNETRALEEAMNKNLLVTFLLANVLTGLVNMLMDTRAVSSATAFFILSLYALTFSSVIGLVNYCGIRLKFW